MPANRRWLDRAIESLGHGDASNSIAAALCGVLESVYDVRDAQEAQDAADDAFDEADRALGRVLALADDLEVAGWTDVVAQLRAAVLGPRPDQPTAPAPPRGGTPL